MLRTSARSKLRGTSTGSGACRQATGSNSDRSARLARSSSRAAAAAGSMPDRGSTRPRYLIRSAGPGALFLLGQRYRFLRRLAHLELAGDRAGVARAARTRSCAAAVPYRWRDRREAHAEGAGELVRPSLMQLREIQG